MSCKHNRLLQIAKEIEILEAERYRIESLASLRLRLVRSNVKTIEAGGESMIDHMRIDICHYNIVYRASTGGTDIIIGRLMPYTAEDGKLYHVPMLYRGKVSEYLYNSLSGKFITTINGFKKRVIDGMRRGAS